MRIKKGLSNCVVLLTLLFTTTQVSAEKLWYKAPAKEWMQSLPIGNGRLGLMVFGGVHEETLALNESTLWSGEYDKNQQRPFGREKLDNLRSLFFQGKLKEGNETANSLTGTPHSFGTHLPMGDVKIKYTYPTGAINNYYRELDLNSAICSSSFNVGEIKYTTESFASNPDNILVSRVATSKPKTLNMEISLSLLRKSNVTVKESQIIFNGKATFPQQGTGGVNFEGRVAISVDGGKIITTDSTIVVKNATTATIYMNIRTDFSNTTHDGTNYKTLCSSEIERAIKKDYKLLKQAHINDYSPMYSRVELKLGDNKNETIPTDERHTKVKAGASDPGLEALFFQFGRYLLIASSRVNSPLPVALQGFFNDNLACTMAWTNDYHLDINTQQNYWIANVGNLADCNHPLFDYIKDLSVHGAKTVKEVYGCKGWTAHTTANVWGFTPSSPGMSWGLFPTAGSWIATHLWTQYEYTQDKKYLKEIGYPLLKGNAEFLLDYMVVDPRNGYLVTGPSISPENSFLYKGDNLCASMMPTCDRELVYEIFNACVKSSEDLGIDKEFADSLRKAISMLPPIPVRANGAIQEWSQDFDEAQPNHRHTSHLLALYPFSQITLNSTPNLAKAARKTHYDRLAAKDWEDTEWSRANAICYSARLKDTVDAYESVKQLLRGLTRENLLSVSPKGIAGAPCDIFIFDGNAAGAAGIAEMLVQCHEGYIELLPCLPIEWKDGAYKGLCVKGGAEMSVDWKNSKITSAKIKANCNNSFKVKLPSGEIRNMDMKKGQIINLL
ncbi:MAG: glycoside hydrolase N-terminal domain-containing protein [Muribaculaceae bacterium]